MFHNDAVTLFGSCRCACHALRDPLAASFCWCSPTHHAAGATSGEPDPERVAELRKLARHRGLWFDAPQLSHSDAIALFGRCTDPGHVDRSKAPRCAQATDPQLTPYVTRMQERALQRRLRTGRATVSEYARHAPWMLTGH